MNARSLVIVPAALLALVAACDAGAGSEVAGTWSGRSAKGLVRIDDVGYGGTAVFNGTDRVILPEFIVLASDADETVSLAEWCLTDSQGGWYGDGLVQFPQGARVPARGFVVVASYPPVTALEAAQGYRQISFETAYGYVPDYEIGGWQPAIADLEHLRGRIRLSQTAETVQLIDGAGTPIEALLAALENGTLAPDRIGDAFPRVEE